MPRSKKRSNRGGQHVAVQPFSDEDVSVETLSHCSSFSDGASIPDEDEAAHEDFHYKLQEYIESTVDKRQVNAKARQSALDALKTALATKILYDFILERRMTITDSIERCLKKGKGDEQRAAASLACLLCIQLGSGLESEELLKVLKPVFRSILVDSAASGQARQACAASLGICSLVAEDDILRPREGRIFGKKTWAQEQPFGVYTSQQDGLKTSSVNLMGWLVLQGLLNQHTASIASRFLRSDRIPLKNLEPNSFRVKRGFNRVQQVAEVYLGKATFCVCLCS
ncbi:interferon-related developmental regulator 1 [Arapaima gigas]